MVIENFLTNKQTNMTTLATYWSMTINNPTEADGVLIRNPNEKYIRQLIWTPEVGADGTPHVQAWLRLQRNQTMAFVKKLYPRAHLKPLTKEDYNENTHDYAQKDDETTAGHHVISMNDPLPGVDTILYRVIEQMIAQHNIFSGSLDIAHVMEWSREVENNMVKERAGLEKLFISGTYDKMKRRFYNEIISRILTQQHDAHEDERQQATIGVLGGVDEDDEGGSEGDEDEVGEDDSDGGEESEVGDSESDSGNE